MAKYGCLGAGVGAAVALFLAALAYFLNSHHVIVHGLDRFYLAIAPTSIILMLTEKATVSAQVLVVLIFAVQNAVIYAVLFIVIGVIWVRLSKRTARHSQL